VQHSSKQKWKIGIVQKSPRPLCQNQKDERVTAHNSTYSRPASHCRPTGKFINVIIFFFGKFTFLHRLKRLLRNRPTTTCDLYVGLLFIVLHNTLSMKSKPTSQTTKLCRPTETTNKHKNIQKYNRLPYIKYRGG